MGHIYKQYSQNGSKHSKAFKKSALGAIITSTGLCSLSSPVLAQDTAQAEDDATIEQIIVTGRLIFRDQQTESAAKISIPLNELPQSVTIITEDVMDLANIRRFDEIYKVDASAGTSHRVDEFPSGYYRGFATQGTNAIRIDGFRFIGNIDLDLAAFSRFEVVKGPTSALYGQNTIGGSLNASLKQAKLERAGEVAFQVGGFNTTRVEADYTNALNDDATIAGRVIGAYEKSDSHVDLITSEHVMVYPTVNFEVGDYTSVTVSGMFQKSDDATAFGMSLQQQPNGEYKLPDVRRSFPTGQAYNSNESEASLLMIKAEHSINDEWKGRILGQYSNLTRQTNAFALFDFLDEDGAAASGCCAYLSDSDDELYGVELNLIGETEIMGMESVIFLGADYTNQTNNSVDSYAYVAESGEFLGFYDIAESPTYNFLSAPRDLPRPSIDDFYYHFEGDNENRFAGITMQLLAEPTDRLKIILAGRMSFDKIESKGRTAIGFGAFGDLVDEEFSADEPVSSRKFTPQVGLSYEATDDVNVYVNWGKTFEPSTDRQFDSADPDGIGNILPPEEGEQVEIGTKVLMFNDSVTFTAAAFRLERSNISAPDPSNNNFSLPLGDQITEGLEFNAVGKINEAWNVIFSSSLLDAEFVDGELDGQRPVNTPDFAVSLFTSYEFLDGPLKNFGISAGYVYKDIGESGALGSDDEIITFDFGDINELSVSIFYESDQWSASLSANNILDDKYYSPFDNAFDRGINVNPGFNALLSLSRRF